MAPKNKNSSSRKKSAKVASPRVLPSSSQYPIVRRPSPVTMGPLSRMVPPVFPPDPPSDRPSSRRSSSRRKRPEPVTPQAMCSPLIKRPDPTPEACPGGQPHGAKEQSTITQAAKTHLRQWADAYVSRHAGGSDTPLGRLARLSDEVVIAVDPKGRRVSRGPLEPLFTKVWLNDACLNTYCEFLTARAARMDRTVHIFSTFFLSRLDSRRFDYGAVYRWSDRSNIVPYDLDVLAFPINTANTHWTAAAVDRRLRAVVHYDSFLSPKGPAIARTILRYLMAEYLRRHPTAERQAVLDAVVPATGEWVIIDGAGQRPLAKAVDLDGIHRAAVKAIKALPGRAGSRGRRRSRARVPSIVISSDSDSDEAPPDPVETTHIPGPEPEVTAALRRWHALPGRARRAAVAQFPRQQNSSDCGVFVGMFLRSVALGQPLWFNQRTMDSNRLMMALEIAHG